MSALVIAVRQRRCGGCGRFLRVSRGCGQPRKWCSERCRRRTLYAGNCVECGARTDGSKGRRRSPARCGRCVLEARKRRARARHIDALREWTRRYGEPPAAADWRASAPSARRTRSAARLAEIDRRHAERNWPPSASTIRIFGSWRAALEAAGVGELSR